MNTKNIWQDLALTPPMGWNSYNTFNCEPTEELVTVVADAIVETGLKDAGYVYVNIDDGWQARERDRAGKLVPHPEKFPNGIKKITDHIHARGLAAGVYLGCGLKTYGEYPGSYGFEERDARLIAEAGFDFLKYDYRELPEDPPGRDVKLDYQRMRDCLLVAGRPMVFSICEHGRSKPWEWGPEIGHLWRTTPDIKDGFEGDIKWGWGIDKIVSANRELYTFAGPGRWNDPDMLVVGLSGKLEWQGPGCTLHEYRTHFTLWCLMASPLLIGCDVRKMDPETAAILKNRELVAVNQDARGVQGRIVRMEETYAVWRKELAGRAVAVGLQNLRVSDNAVTLERTDTGFAAKDDARVRDLWKHDAPRAFQDKLEVPLAPHETAVFRIEAV